MVVCECDLDQARASPRFNNPRETARNGSAGPPSNPVTIGVRLEMQDGDQDRERKHSGDDRVVTIWSPPRKIGTVAPRWLQRRESGGSIEIALPFHELKIARSRPRCRKTEGSRPHSAAILP